eukprot:6493818-Prymnesium_polylepis.1
MSIERRVLPSTPTLPYNSVGESEVLKPPRFEFLMCTPAPKLSNVSVGRTVVQGGEGGMDGEGGGRLGRGSAGGGGD